MTETLEEKKLRCKGLIDDKEAMEMEMDTLFEFFGRKDIKSFKILDKDGCPNEDSAKIYEIRMNKHRLEVLKTDHKKLVSDIETLLCEIHAIQKAASPLPKKPETEVPKPESKVVIDLTKFELLLRVDSVMEGSPAALGGLKVGDAIVKYGSVDVATYMAEDKTYLLEDVNSVTKSSIGRSIRVEAVRGSENPILNVTPNKWDGPGILGCHFTF